MQLLRRAAQLVSAIGACATVGYAADAVEALDLRPPPDDIRYGAPPEGRDHNVYGPDVNWGVGYLAPDPSPELLERLLRESHVVVNELWEHGGWPSVFTLPLFDGPDGAQWGWLTNGLVRELDTGAQAEVAAHARIRIDYDFERDALFVLTERDDGWLEFRWGGEDDFRNGRAWTHLDLQSAGEARGTFVRWRDHLTNAGPLLTYRNREAAHVLRAGPDRSHTALRRIEGENWTMEALDFAGDWMRVRFQWPSTQCGGFDAADVEHGDVEGWVRWRSPEQGPWFYYPVGGC